jgi:hypothetical protein
VVVICFLRRQDILLAKGYSQEVKALGRSDVIQGVAYAKELDWHRLYCCWESAFPKAKLKMYNYGRRALLETFKAAAGISAETDDEVGERHANRSLNAEMTEVARVLNARGQPSISDKLITLQERVGGPPFGFAAHVVERLEAIYLPSNRALAARFPDGEFDDLACPGWQPTGIDLSGKVSDGRIEEIMASVRSLGL